MTRSGAIRHCLMDSLAAVHPCIAPMWRWICALCFFSPASARRMALYGRLKGLSDELKLLPLEKDTHSPQYFLCCVPSFPSKFPLSLYFPLFLLDQCGFHQTGPA
ncbi:hypothetical protein P170DRAFT_439683 [Aspergillus steynii IBT 23096]|uniref:Uncharacterized protein n=1 Tax=Aspergillus steynii IBT 23096 TaxID=1392250 RepID=A0A2I2FZD0_9EURO|nr:uncharacterized protein P170DRAFT_439683 [Aspergillus steynii IBT 23096]PLB45984.1 hypothetical protein P170DRAFT_439683 [Aspergillus steynii IBT 23096]